MNDRLPPHSAELEAAALGCALLDSRLAQELQREWFDRLEYQQAANVILALVAEGAPVEVGLVAQRLTASGDRLRKAHAATPPADAAGG